MKKARYLAIIFIASVILPSSVLAVLTIRSAAREEAYLEKQLETTLLAEITHVTGLVNSQIAMITDELRQGIDVPSDGDYEAIFSRWKSAEDLVQAPFLLSALEGVVWPPSSMDFEEEERLFFEENSDFLSDRTPTAVLKDIAVEYQSEILAASAPLAGSASVAAAPASRAAAPAPSAGSVPAAESPPAVQASSAQKAIDTFAQSEAIQEKTFAEARQKGEEIVTRNVQAVPQAEPSAAGGAQSAGAADATLSQTADAPASQQSRFIIRSQLLSEIAAQGEAGIIPRMIGDKLSFLFWEKQADGRIAGCGIDVALFRARIAAVLPGTYSEARIMTIIDETGSPLAAPPGEEQRNWRRAFVSREIGETLPRWEVASYLTRPDAISARARASSTVIWVLVAIMLASVGGGGFMVLSSLYGEMRLAQKKATFVANVSHELKTPLTSIRLFVDLMREKGSRDPDKQERYLALMASETERLARLIGNVLSFSSAEKGATRYSMKSRDAVSVVREIVESQRVRLEAGGFSLGVSSTETSALAHVDEEAVKQVILNLLSNAEKYSPQAKEIRVEIRREGGAIDVHVKDRGIGVAEKERENIFREFYRVDDSLASRTRGTGLGLTIARRIARDHGGDITVAAREGGGSDFCLRLPAVEGTEA